MRAKWRRFCEEYLVDLHAAAAYERAGYRARGASAWAAASRLLANPEVQRCVAGMMQERALRTRVSADGVVDELSRIAFSRFTEVVEFNSGGIQLKDSVDLDESVVAAIEEVSQTEVKGAVTVRVKFVSKIAALRLLSQHLGLLTDLNIAIATCNRHGLKVVSDLGQFSEFLNSSHLAENSGSAEQFESALEIPGESWGTD